MVSRPQYMDKLIAFRDKQLIKVISGIRRCGKSTLLELFREYLLEQGVLPEQMQSINFEMLEYEELRDYRTLYDYLKERLIPENMNYIFLDEIQNVEEFQKCVDSLYTIKNVDIYLTGSNAYMLSGEIATLLSGRYIEIQMLPLSFQEYVSSFPDPSDLSRKYRDYLINSSFPYALELGGDANLIREYLGGIYHTVLIKDIVTHRRINDVSMLESVIRFMFDNIGNLCSIKKISDTLTSAGRKTTTHTIEGFISALQDSYVMYRAGRYDVKGKQYLKTGGKYYVVDIGLRYYLLGSKGADAGHILENVIFLELLRRGHEVYVGKVGQAEVDFIVMGKEGTAYYQVAATVRDPDTLARELAPLDSISDHNPKYLLTLDDDPPASHNGIRQINALDWLMKE